MASRVRVNGSGPVFVLAPAVLLAGCAGGDAGAPRDSASPAVSTGPGQGGMEGVAMDDEAAPVVNVRVVVQTEAAGSFEAVTGSDGSYAVGGLPAGTHRVFAEKLGFESIARPVTITQGQTTRLDLIMNPIVVAEARHETQILAGFIGCSVTVIYPAGNPGYTAWLCGDSVANQAWYPNHQPYLSWEIPAKVMTHLLELTWDPTSASADQLRWQIAVNLDCYLSLCFTGDNYQTQGGPGPLVYRLEDGAGLPQTLPSPFMSRVSSGPTTNAAPVRVVLEQAFEQYTTNHFGTLAPEGFTALPPPE